MLKRDNEAGFSILELVVYVACLGVIVSIAVPKFTTMIATANTGKIQADLQTLNGAITMYQLDNGVKPQKVEPDLNQYVSHLENLKPPKGKCFLKGEIVELTKDKYELSTTKEEAALDGHIITEFVKANKDIVQEAEPKGASSD